MKIPDSKLNEWFPYVQEDIRKDAKNIQAVYENGFILHEKHGIYVKIRGETKHDGEILYLTGWQRGQMLKKVLGIPFTLRVKKKWFSRVSVFLFLQGSMYDDLESVSTIPPPPLTIEV